VRYSYYYHLFGNGICSGAKTTTDTASTTKTTKTAAAAATFV